MSFFLLNPAQFVLISSNYHVAFFCAPCVAVRPAVAFFHLWGFRSSLTTRHEKKLSGETWLKYKKYSDTRRSSNGQSERGKFIINWLWASGQGHGSAGMSVNTDEGDSLKYISS